MIAFDATPTITAFNVILPSVHLPQIIDVCATKDPSKVGCNVSNAIQIVAPVKNLPLIAQHASKGRLLVTKVNVSVMRELTTVTN